VDTSRTQMVLAPFMASDVCGTPETRAILDRGGQFAYRFLDGTGAYLATVRVTRFDCR
jgi:hypothetical protein